ncbi:MAG: DEAD/DEAH box helicase, partial [Myxococcaceae bacterium]|nr:DEAD/DEAH box helicase [Myxococcaceae bacterium]
RREIEPLSTQDFMRFLFRWHHLEEDDTLRGEGGLQKAVSLLQGVEAPAAAWELALLPARMRNYQPELLEQACFSGQLAWGRLTPREGRTTPGPARGRPLAAAAATPSTQTPPLSPANSPLPLGEGQGEGAVHEAVPTPPTTPRPSVSRAANITFALRTDLDWLLAAARPDAKPGSPWRPQVLSTAAQDVLAVLENRGACFFQDIVTRSRRLAAEVEDALWELLAQGAITADAVQNLRVLQSPAKRKRQKLLQRGGPGRWSLLELSEDKPTDEVLEHLARLFLQRWGILFRELALREPLCPPWRDLVRVLRRMEARSELRGGRFVQSVGGEQFALPEAVDLARAVRRKAPSGARVHLAAVDPLNLTGVVTPGSRVPAVLGHWVTYVDGVPQGVEERATEDAEE